MERRYKSQAHPEGTEVIKKINNYRYWYKKVNGKFRPLHRIRYEEEFGPIPIGFRIYFKDNNILNCEPENLGLKATHFVQKPPEKKIRKSSKFKKIECDNALDLILNPNYSVMHGWGWKEEHMIYNRNRKKKR